MTITSERILYEDNHLLIVNKLPGEIVQGDKTGDEPLVETLKSYIKEKYNKPGAVFLGVVHRLDRPVSGAVIFARTSKALARMNEMLKERELRKVYWAVVGQLDKRILSNCPTVQLPTGSISHTILKGTSSRINPMHMIIQGRGGKKPG